MAKRIESGNTTTERMIKKDRIVDMDRAKRHLTYVLGLANGADVGEDVMQAANLVLSELTAGDMATAALLSNMPGETALVLWNRARRALHSLAPVVMMRLAAKIDDESSPGSERILIEVAKGIGLLTQTAPVDESQRETVIQRSDISEMTTVELRRRLIDGTGGE